MGGLSKTMLAMCLKNQHVIIPLVRVTNHRVNNFYCFSFGAGMTDLLKYYDLVNQKDKLNSGRSAVLFRDMQSWKYFFTKFLVHKRYPPDAVGFKICHKRTKNCCEVQELGGTTGFILSQSSSSVSQIGHFLHELWHIRSCVNLQNVRQHFNITPAFTTLVWNIFYHSCVLASINFVFVVVAVKRAWLLVCHLMKCILLLFHC